MASFGRNLRREREMRGISLDEIAQHTKISTRMLEAIESDRFELLPGGVFNRSFVLHYARYIGLDENQVGAEFDLANGTAVEVDILKVVAQREQRALEPPPAATPGPSRTALQRLALVMVSSLLLGLGGYALWKWQWLTPAAAVGPAPGQAAAPAQPSAASPPARQPGTPAAPNARTGASRQPAGGPPAPATQAAGVDPSRARLRLQVDTMGPSWAVAYADGRKSWEAEMRAGETRTVAADSSIRLRVGNAGAVVLTLNGETQAPLGRKGEVKTVSFTSEDLKKQ